MPSYRLSFAECASHHVDVEMWMDARSEAIELWMPTWTPGSYLIREFARHVRDISAVSADGRDLAVIRVDKATFRVATRKGDTVTIRYRLYCNDPTVRTNFADDRYAILNGAGTFFAVRGAETEEHVVSLDLPAKWTCVSGLREGDGPHQRLATDYDELIDGPIAVGSLAVQEFQAGGKRHVYAVAGAGNHDVSELAIEATRIVQTSANCFGPLPYSEYVFILFTTKDAQGGLEHRNSTVLAFPRFGFRDPKTKADLASLVAHEHFHAWNVKRTKPREFAPYDLSNETYTRALWICEGVTSYYDEQIVLRAGLVTRDVYLSRLEDDFNRYFENPGRLEQDLEESSLSTWIRFYRQDEDYPNSAISYYLKGGLVALLLDLEIRSATDSRRSLDDVMRCLFERHPYGSEGFSTDEFEALAGEVAGTDLQSFFDRCVRSTEELDFAEPLARFGIRWSLVERTPAPSARDWIGVRIKAGANPLKIDVVERGSPAASGGLLPNDEIVAIDGIRANAGTLAQRLEERRDATARLVIFRDDAIHEKFVAVPKAPSRVVKVVIWDDAPADVLRRRDAWLPNHPSEPARK